MYGMVMNCVWRKTSDVRNSIETTSCARMTVIELSFFLKIQEV